MILTNTAGTHGRPAGDNEDNGDNHSECRALGQLLSLIGDKWTVMVVGALSHGPLRFNELRRHIEGISQRMLTLTLRRLEEENLVTRTVFPTIPPRVDYELSPQGHTLIEPLSTLAQWARGHRESKEQAALLKARSRGMPLGQDKEGML